MGSGASAREVIRDASANTIVTKDVKKAPRKCKLLFDRIKFKNEPKDVMISYSHKDTDVMTRIQGALVSRGITVWVDTLGLNSGVDFISKIGQAIMDAKVFVCLVSGTQIESRFCNDELALAYISHKEIIPVLINNESRDDLYNMMDRGMYEKMHLSKNDWHVITEPGNSEEPENLEEPDSWEEPGSWDDEVSALVDKIRQVLTSDDWTKDGQKDDNKEMDAAEMPPIGKKTTYRSSIASYLKTINTLWQRNFPGQKHVKWDRFWETVCVDHRTQIKQYRFVDEDLKWFSRLMEYEMCPWNNVLTNKSYTDFCTTPDGRLVSFWPRMMEFAEEYEAMREIFSLDTSIRLCAITNLCKFDSFSIAQVLLELTHDDDNNVKVTAILSLAKIRHTQSDGVGNRLVSCLTETDRLVREVACVTLGCLREKRAVKALARTWRCDIIEQVREAAFRALQTIGGEEADEAIRMTQMISDAIQLFISSYP